MAGKKWAMSLASSYRAFILFMRVLFSWPNHFSRAPPPNITSGIRYQLMNLWGAGEDTNIQFAIPGVFVFYCCVTNFHKLSSLKQPMFIISQLDSLLHFLQGCDQDGDCLGCGRTFLQVRSGCPQGSCSCICQAEGHDFLLTEAGSCLSS